MRSEARRVDSISGHEPGHAEDQSPVSSHRPGPLSWSQMIGVAGLGWSEQRIVDAPC